MHDPYLAATAIIDHAAPAVRGRAAELKRATPHATAQACFEWVRDHIEHCIDAQRGPVRLRASDVLEVGIGYCYSQSHLLAALLRANGLRAGLCYQRLTLNGPSAPAGVDGKGLNDPVGPGQGVRKRRAGGTSTTSNAGIGRQGRSAPSSIAGRCTSTGYCLHGLNAVWLNGAWYRIDPRGNRADVDAQFTPPIEHLAFPIVHPGEYTLPEVYAEPLATVVRALATQPHWRDLLTSLPDTPR